MSKRLLFKFPFINKGLFYDDDDDGIAVERDSIEEFLKMFPPKSVGIMTTFGMMEQKSILCSFQPIENKGNPDARYLQEGK